MQFKVVLCTKEWEGLPGVKGGVKGHREHIVTNTPTSVLFVVGFPQSAALGGREGEEEERVRKEEDKKGVMQEEDKGMGESKNKEEKERGGREERKGDEEKREREESQLEREEESGREGERRREGT